jgi:hypothetical protein
MLVQRPARLRLDQAWKRRLMARQKSWLTALRRMTTGSPVEPEVRVSRIGPWPSGMLRQ